MTMADPPLQNDDAAALNERLLQMTDGLPQSSKLKLAFMSQVMTIETQWSYRRFGFDMTLTAKLSLID